jgi:hypothetical protein
LCLVCLALPALALPALALPASAGKIARARQKLRMKNVSCVGTKTDDAKTTPDDGAAPEAKGPHEDEAAHYLQTKRCEFKSINQIVTFK